ncbi:DUS2 [Symbiodinium sp. CCMP2456]|nr:DUS2 [Symbiodinium sp. CCMP2456]
MDAVEAEAAFTQAHQGFMSQLEGILASTGSATRMHRGVEDACRQMCIFLAGMCRWFDGPDLANYLMQWKQKFESLEDSIAYIVLHVLLLSASTASGSSIAKAGKVSPTSMFWCFNDQGSMVSHSNKLTDQFFYCGRRIEGPRRVAPQGRSAHLVGTSKERCSKAAFRETGVAASFAEE